ncbi:hypothetical protein ACQY0O_001700 [Thecaphora frezii]
MHVQCAGLHRASTCGDLSYALPRQDLARWRRLKLIWSLLADAFARSRLLCIYAAILTIKAVNAVGKRLIDRQAPCNIVWNEHIVVITGAARGILVETAKRLAQRGAKAVVLDMTPKSEHGAETLYISANVTLEASLQEARERMEKEVGLCTMLIAGVGLGRHSFLLDPPEVIPLDFAIKVSDVNLRCIVAMLKVFGQHMLPDGNKRERGELKQARNGWGGHILLLGSGTTFVD